jgi:hypothetical protein
MRADLDRVDGAGRFGLVDFLAHEGGENAENNDHDERRQQVPKKKSSEALERGSLGFRPIRRVRF